MRHTEKTDDVFPHDYYFEYGHLYCGEGAGHGVSLNEELAVRYPYDPK